MAEYLIAFNDEWVPEHTMDELRAKSKALKPLLAEMRAAGVLIFTGGLDTDLPVFSVDASSGAPVFTDGPYVETKEHLGGFAVVDVADEDAARLWAGKIAVACDWPQQVHRFQVPLQRVRSHSVAAQIAADRSAAMPALDMVRTWISTSSRSSCRTRVTTAGGYLDSRLSASNQVTWWYGSR